MPRYDGKVTVWIKKGDRDKWDALRDIPSFIHQALNNSKEMRFLNKPPKTLTAKPLDFNKPIKTPQDVPELKRDDPKWEGPMWKKGKK